MKTNKFRVHTGVFGAGVYYQNSLLFQVEFFSDKPTRKREISFIGDEKIVTSIKATANQQTKLLTVRFRLNGKPEQIVIELP